MTDVFVTNHDRWHAEIAHFLERANEAQSAFAFKRFRLNDDDKRSLYRSPLDVDVAFPDVAALRPRYEIAESAPLVAVVDSNVRDREDDEYFFYTDPERRIALVSAYHLDPRSAFMTEGARWWSAATERQRERITSGSLLVALVGATTRLVASVGTHPDTRGCVMDHCETPTDIAATLRHGIAFCAECRSRLEATVEGQAMIRIADALRNDPMRRFQLSPDELDPGAPGRAPAEEGQARGAAARDQPTKRRGWMAWAASALLVAVAATAVIAYLRGWFEPPRAQPPGSPGGYQDLKVRGVRVHVRRDDGTSQPVELYRNSYALLIANERYTAGWEPLFHPADDTRKVEAALRASGFQVETRHDLDADALERALKTFFIQKGADPGDRLLVWYSGHGHSRGPAGREEGYLVPVDAPLPDHALAFMDKALPIRRFGEWMRLASAKHVIAVFDSCFAGTVFAIARASPPAAVTLATTYPVRQFITSGDADQTVLDDGRFADLFVRALRGEEGDLNGDGYVTGTELGFYLYNRVTNLGKAQTPRYGKLLDADLDRGDFVFVVPTRVVAPLLPRPASGVARPP